MYRAYCDKHTQFIFNSKKSLPRMKKRTYHSSINPHSPSTYQRSYFLYASNPRSNECGRKLGKHIPCRKISR
uniref:Ovule protein n=1 Tax=Echinococcus granulosus TaxID=6210 RepID=A0A068WJD6_ECHGR|nr:hypothetical protein EgrG_001053500 [Echinococcus granulosus]